MNGRTSIERVRVRGFRSLADFELADLPRAAVLIGANGAGKSNFIRFFESSRLDGPICWPGRTTSSPRR